MLPQFQQLSLLRKFSLDELARLTDTEILQLFRAARWGQSDNLNQVVCPQCGKRHIAYWIRTRQQWQCKHCQRRFSVTSGTVFANHKISLRKILICLFEVRHCRQRYSCHSHCGHFGYSTQTRLGVTA